MAILDQVTYPKDLKNLSFDELDTLSKEIRELIIEVVSKNGGHLSSNLGAVDLTIALHRVFAPCIPVSSSHVPNPSRGS